MSAKMTGISVVIPCYKKPAIVFKCINLLLKSHGLGKHFSLEVILVDNSPDKRVKNVAEKLSKRELAHVSFKYRKPAGNDGIAMARNIGVSMASNGVVLALDTDILVEKNTVLETLKTFHGTNAGLVTGNVYWKGGPVDGKLDRPRKHDRRVRIGKTEYMEMTHGRYIAFLKAAFKKVGGYDAALFPMQGEGPDLSIRFWRAGYPIVFNRKIKVHHLSGYKKGDKVKSPFLYHGWSPERSALMFRSIMLYFFKYGCLDSQKSNWMNTIAMESEKNFGEKAEYIILSSLSTTLEWIAENWNKLEKSRKGIPKKYDFKPYDVFTDRKLFMKCIRSRK